MNITQVVNNFVKSRPLANSTDSVWLARGELVGPPLGPGGNGDGVLHLVANELQQIDVPSTILLVPYGVGVAGQTFSLRIYGWKPVGPLSNPNPVGQADTRVWIPILLCEIACTLGTGVGLANQTPSSSENFVTTITLTTGNSNFTSEILSPGSNNTAHMMQNVKGFQIIEVVYQLGTATNANCLVASV